MKLPVPNPISSWATRYRWKSYRFYDSILAIFCRFLNVANLWSPSSLDFKSIFRVYLWWWAKKFWLFLICRLVIPWTSILIDLLIGNKNYLISWDRGLANRCLISWILSRLSFSMNIEFRLEGCDLMPLHYPNTLYLIMLVYS